MKCIHCQTDSTYPDRQKSGGRCKKCQHPFAFEPKTTALAGPVLTDGLFQRLIKEVSTDGKTAFTERQLWWEMNRRWQRMRLKAMRGGGIAFMVMGAVGGLIGSLLTMNPIPLVLGAAAVGGGLHLFRKEKSASAAPVEPAVPWANFAPLLARWREVHGDPPRLADPRVPAPKQVDYEPDLTTYSFDRAVVTEHADTAAMLVAGNFHFENNCAVLSLDGYPQGRSKTVLEMLRRNPSLKVFAVHDASIPGYGLAQRLREPDWFPDQGIRIFDLGLRKAQAEALKLSVVKAPYSHASNWKKHGEAWQEGLPPDEIAWLSAGNAYELAELRPARLMRAIYQGFSRANQLPDGTDAATGWDTGPGMIWFYSPTADLHATDSFG